jgi:gamma-glutamyl-gamma-aminobutyrate hydrolase PuuD
VKDFWIIATSQDGYVEAIAHKEYKIWGIMWHPERSPFNKTNLDLLKDCFQ